MKKNRNIRVGVVDKMVWFDGLMKFERMVKSINSKTCDMVLAYGDRLLKTSPFPPSYTNKNLNIVGGGVFTVAGDGYIFNTCKLILNEGVSYENH